MTQSFLRRILLADAATSAATGVLLLADAGLLAELLALPADLLRFSGIVLLPFAALVALLATREHLPRRAVWAVIAANALWALGSVLLLVSGWIEPAALGIAFVLAQALVVALFAEAEYVGLRRTEAAFPA
jgi:hypothetical protein